MEYQKIIILLDNTSNQPVKFKTENWVGINDYARRTYNTSILIKSSLCDYSDAYTLASGTITVENTGAAATPNNRKNIIIKSCAPCTDCISEISNT